MFKKRAFCCNVGGQGGVVKTMESAAQRSGMSEIRREIRLKLANAHEGQDDTVIIEE